MCRIKSFSSLPCTEILIFFLFSEIDNRSFFCRWCKWRSESLVCAFIGGIFRVFIFRQQNFFRFLIINTNQKQLSATMQPVCVLSDAYLPEKSGYLDGHKTFLFAFFFRNLKKWTLFSDFWTLGLGSPL